MEVVSIILFVALLQPLFDRIREKTIKTTLSEGNIQVTGRRPNRKVLLIASEGKLGLLLIYALKYCRISQVCLLASETPFNLLSPQSCTYPFYSPIASAETMSV